MWNQDFTGYGTATVLINDQINIYRGLYFFLQQDSASLRRQMTFNENLPAFIFDPSLDARRRAKLLEIEMNEQAKTVNDLKMLGASASTIEQEMRRLQASLLLSSNR